MGKKILFGKKKFFFRKSEVLLASPAQPARAYKKHKNTHKHAEQNTLQINSNTRLADKIFFSALRCTCSKEQSEVGNYERKQESEKERRHAFDQESKIQVNTITTKKRAEGNGKRNLELNILPHF